MDSNGLLTKLLGVLFNHLLAALVCDVCESLCLFIFLLDSEEAHFSLIKTLFRIPQHSNIGLQSLEVLQVLCTALFLELNC